MGTIDDMTNEPPRPAPATSFTDASGRQHTLAEFLGNGVVVNFWATWCVPCVEEMPALAELSRALAPSGIGVLPLSSDRGGAAAVKRFFDTYDIHGLPVLLDPGSAAMTAFGSRGIPTTVIIDAAGRERGRLEGAVDWSSRAAADRIRALVRV